MNPQRETANRYLRAILELPGGEWFRSEAPARSDLEIVRNTLLQAAELLERSGKLLPPRIPRRSFEDCTQSALKLFPLSQR